MELGSAGGENGQGWGTENPGRKIDRDLIALNIISKSLSRYHPITLHSP